VFRVFFTPFAKLRNNQTVLIGFLVFSRMIIHTMAVGTFQCNQKVL
jgi:hypothetical protein